MPTISPSRSRIHQEAFWRGGAGAGHEGQTQNLMLRVRGKWFPSGDVGRMRSSRADFSFRSLHWAPGVPVRHWRVTGQRHAASAGFVKNPGRAAQVEDDAP